MPTKTPHFLPNLYGINHNLTDLIDYRKSAEHFHRYGRERESSAVHLALIIITVMLVIVGVVGSLGNALVVYVFSHHLRNGVSNLFITLLAGIDLVICLVDIPATLYWQVWQRDSLDVICKIHTTLKAFFIPASVALLVLIAVDRFLLICFLPGIRIQRKWAYISIALTIVASLCLAFPMGLHVGVRKMFDTTVQDLLVTENVSTILDTQPQFHWKRNYDIGHCDNDQRFISNENYRYYTLFIFVLFCLIFAAICILYSILFCFIWLRTSHRSRLLRTTILLQQTRRHTTTISLCDLSNNQLPPIDSTNSPDDNPSKEASTDLQAECPPEVTTAVMALVTPPPVRKKRARVSTDLDSSPRGTATTAFNNTIDYSVPTLPEEHRYASLDDGMSAAFKGAREYRESVVTCSESMRPLHVKTARTLALVTITFAISYVPYLLIVNEFIWPARHMDLARFNKPLSTPTMQVYLKRVLFYLYFVNSAANPIIYSCMNQTFRNDLQLLRAKIKSTYFTANA